MFTQPNFFFIGGMRCGSTSLKLMLEQHPEIYMSPIKEPYYYLAQAIRNKENPSQEDFKFLQKFEKGGKYRTTETYRSLFQNVGGAKIVGEASHYLYHSKAIPAIYKDCPDARILVCLRNPVDRLFSEYLLYIRRGSETGSFSEFVNRHVTPFVKGEVSQKRSVPRLDKGLQADLLEKWLAQFGADQLKVIFFDVFNENPSQTMNDIFRWLDVDTSFSAEKIHAQKGGAPKVKWLTSMMNSQHSLSKKIKSQIPKSARTRLRSAIFTKTLERPEMEEKTRLFLIDFYRDDVDTLSKMLGRDLSDWVKA